MKPPGAFELEERAARSPPPAPHLPAPTSEAEAMLRRRGFFTTQGKLRLPFPADLEEPRAAALMANVGRAIAEGLRSLAPTIV